MFCFHDKFGQCSLSMRGQALQCHLFDANVANVAVTLTVSSLFSMAKLLLDRFHCHGNFSGRARYLSRGVVFVKVDPERSRTWDPEKLTF